ncbi:hypothetical protein D9M70_649140 [compost metagenome]
MPLDASIEPSWKLCRTRTGASGARLIMRMILRRRPACVTSEYAARSQSSVAYRAKDPAGRAGGRRAGTEAIRVGVIFKGVVRMKGGGTKD